MKKTYTTEEILKKFKRLKTLSLFIIIIGIIFIIMSLFKEHGGTFQSIGQMLDDLLILGSGTYLLLFSNKKLKKITGEILIFDENGAIIHLNEKKIKLDKDNKPKVITINLKTISIITHNNQEIVVNLDNYSSNTMTRKEIKKQFENLKEKFTLPNTGS